MQMSALVRSSSIANLTSETPIVKMVCPACLLPLFLIPVINLLCNFIVAKVYRLFGWEYRKPAGAPTACPIKSSASKTSADDSVTGTHNLGDSVPSPNPLGTNDDGKQD